jgi:hypothetical protein
MKSLRLATLWVLLEAFVCVLMLAVVYFTWEFFVSLATEPAPTTWIASESDDSGESHLSN